MPPEKQPQLKVHQGGTAAVPKEQAAQSLAALLQFEAGLRRQGEVMELLYFLANETQAIVPCDQIFVMRAARIGSGFEVAASSSVATVDRNAPLIQAVERILSEQLAGRDASEPFEFQPPRDAYDLEIDEYPFRQWYWQGFQDRDGETFGGLLFVREKAFRETDKGRSARVAESASHAWLALAGGKPVRRIRKPSRVERRALLIALGLLMLFPVRMTGMAPVEVIAARPYTLAAPINGVVSQIHVIPNAPVKEGQTLVTFDDVKLRNEVELAREAVAVASARAERANSEAFSDDARAREISIARSELELAKADLAFAQDMAKRSVLIAPRDGTAIYSDRRDWEGKAVQIGDPIMQLADPQDVVFRVDLPAREQMALKRGNDVEIFLDSQPLWAVNASLETASYQARMTPEGTLAFALTARPIGEAPRIGSRGTAKVYGQWVPLFYSLLRRPIATFRQTLGF